jgi:hypothetical protein
VRGADAAELQAINVASSARFIAKRVRGVSRTTSEIDACDRILPRVEVNHSTRFAAHVTTLCTICAFATDEVARA